MSINIGKMRIWPEGAWYGLTPRGRRVLLWSVACCAIALALLYGALRSYVVYETHRGAQLLEALSHVQLGDSEESHLGLARRFPVWKGADPGDPAGTYGYVLVLTPWFPVRNLTHSYDWATDAFVRYFPTQRRRRIGLRDFDVAGGFRIRNGRVIEVWAEVLVEGRNGLLKAQWDLVNSVPQYILDEPRLQAPQSHFHMAHLHYGHPVYYVQHGWVVEAYITPQASESDKAAAHNINLKCLTSFTGCADLSDLAPDAAGRVSR